METFNGPFCPTKSHIDVIKNIITPEVLTISEKKTC